MKNEAPKKPKLFLTSTDVSELTGCSPRNARNLIKHIREELHLGKHQFVSIYAFSKVFIAPTNVLFIYINTNDFESLPVSQEDLSQMEYGDIKRLLTHFRHLTSGEFDSLINHPRKEKSTSE